MRHAGVVRVVASRSSAMGWLVRVGGRLLRQTLLHAHRPFHLYYYLRNWSGGN